MERRNNRTAEKKTVGNGAALWPKIFRTLHEIVGLSPWSRMGPRDILAYEPMGEHRMVISNCVRLKNGDEGLLIYPTVDDYRVSMEWSNLPPLEAEHSYIETEVYTIFLGPRERVPKEFEPMLTELPEEWHALWPRIGHKKRGCPNVVPEEADLPGLADYLEHCAQQLYAILLQGQTVNFDQGEMLLRHYNHKDKIWYNVPVYFKIPPVRRNPLYIEEDDRRVGDFFSCSHPKSEACPQVEFEYGWLREPVWDEKRHRMYHPVGVTFTDRNTEELLAVSTCHLEELSDCVIETWCRLVHTHGQPETLYFCHDKSEDIIRDLAEKTGVRCRRVSRLPAAERLMRSQGVI